MAWDESGSYCANTAYFILNAEKWLTALLNSTVIEWFYDQISTRMQGGYLRAFTDKMQTLPIPPCNSKQRKIIETCIDTVRFGVRAPDYERLLNGPVYELFFPEDLHAQNIRLFDACGGAGISAGMNAKTMAAFFAPGHPVEAQLRSLQTLAVVRLIENQPSHPEPAPVYESNQPLAQAA